MKYIQLFMIGVLSIVALGLILAPYLASKKYEKKFSISIDEKLSDPLPKFLRKNKLFGIFSLSISYKLATFNNWSKNKNLKVTEMALMYIFFASLIIIASLFIILPIWYVALLYVITYLLSVGLLYELMHTYSKTRFSSYLPSLLKSVDERIDDFDNIVDLLNYTKERKLKKPLKNQIERIVDALSLNNKEEIKNEIFFMKTAFDNDTFSIFLEVIYESKYTGVNKTVTNLYHMLSSEIETNQTYNVRVRSKVITWFSLYVILVASSIFVILPYSLSLFENITKMPADIETLDIQLANVMMWLTLIIAAIHLTQRRRFD